MATKPDIMPAWATDDQEAELEQPAAGLVTRGFRTGEPADPGLWNWLKKKVCEWLDYFEQATDELDTKIDIHVHDGTPIPKVDFSDHIEYGSYGLMKVTSDDTLGHTISYESVDGTTPIELDVEGRVRAGTTLIGQYVNVTQVTASGTPWDTLGQANLIKAYAEVSFIYDVGEANNWRVEWDQNLGFAPSLSGFASDAYQFRLLGTGTDQQTRFYTPIMATANVTTLQADDLGYQGGHITEEALDFDYVSVAPRKFNTTSNLWDYYISSGDSGDIFTIKLTVL